MNKLVSMYSLLVILYIYIVIRTLYLLRSSQCTYNYSIKNNINDVPGCSEKENA